MREIEAGEKDTGRQLGIAAAVIAILGGGGYALYSYLKEKGVLPPPGPPGPPSTAGIYGKVTNARTGEPIKNALITAMIMLNGETGEPIMVYSDEEGYYEITGLTPGKNFVMVEKDFYHMSYTYITLVADQWYRWNVQLEEGIVFSEIYGLVTDARTGQPIGGATITFESYQVSPITGMTDLRIVETDAQGNYTVDLAPPTGATETYKITAVAWPDYQIFERDIEVTPGEDEEFNFQMTKYLEPPGDGILQGYVTDYDTAGALAGVKVSITSSFKVPINDVSAHVSYSAMTNAQGYYIIENIPEVEYEVLATHELDPDYDVYMGSITVIGSTVYNIAMWKYTPPTPASRIYGTVTDSKTGALLSNVWVGLSWPGAGRETYTNNLGQYEFADLYSSREVGNYWLTFIKTGYKSIDIQDIFLEIDEAKKQDIKMEPVISPGKASIHGLVRDYDTGDPIEGASVDFMTEDEAYSYETVTDWAGQYRIDNMEALRYKVGCWAPGYDFLRDTWVTLSPGEDRGLNIDLVPYS